MSTLAKNKFVIAAGVGLVGMIIYSHVKKAAFDLTYQLTAIGKPTLLAGELIMPVTVQFANPSDVPFPITNMDLALFTKTSENTWLQVGSIKPTGTFLIAPGLTKQIVYASIITKAFGSNVLMALANLLKTYTIKVVANVNIEGFILPEEKIINLAA